MSRQEGQNSKQCIGAFANLLNPVAIDAISRFNSMLTAFNFEHNTYGRLHVYSFTRKKEDIKNHTEAIRLSGKQINYFSTPRGESLSRIA